MSPSQAVAQWLSDTSSLAYRCGGSTGMMSCGHAPVSRLTAAEDPEIPALRHLARDLSLIASSEARDYSVKPLSAERHIASCEI